MDVGQELRQARERRGISLLQLSQVTKISPRVLQVIEASDVDRLPARVFTRAFVRSYAVEVGLDPEDSVQRYFDQFDDELERTEHAGPAEPDRTPDIHVAPAPAEGPRRPPVRILHGRFGTSAVLIVAGLTAVVLALRQRGPAQAVTTAAPTVAAAGFAPAATAPAAPVGTSGTTPAPADALHIALSASGPCWVQATTADARLFAGLLNAGDRRTIDAPSEVTLRIGDPSTFAFTINGRPARIAGAAAQAVSVTITRENYTQFLSR